MLDMSAEQLIALEAALAELGTLYASAKGFTALQPRADAELLPRLIGLGSSLRSRLRHAQLNQDEIDAVAEEIVALRSDWRSQLEQLRFSSVYQQARIALAEERPDDLETLIPQVFAGLHRVQPAPSLYFSVSPSSGRRRPGSSPFVSAPECATRVVHLLTAGVTPEESTDDWWERDLPSIRCADAMEGLETPIALQLAAAHVRVAVFALHDEPSFRIFTRCLRAPFSVVLAAEATDEWWEAYDDSYRSFRTALQNELAARGHTAAVAGE
jgi:hypothetical protein